MNLREVASLSQNQPHCQAQLTLQLSYSIIYLTQMQVYRTVRPTVHITRNPAMAHNLDDEDSQGIPEGIPTTAETFDLMFKRVNALYGEGWSTNTAARTIPLLEQCASQIREQIKSATKTEDKNHLQYEYGFLSNLANLYRARTSVHSEDPNATERAQEAHFRHINHWGVRRNG